MRTCTKCGVEKPLEQFYKHAAGRDGRQSVCSECVKAYVKRNRAENAEHYREFDRARARRPDRVAARKAYARANPTARPERDRVKRAARIAVGNAVRDGKLVKPAICDVCASECNPHAHHDDYSKPLSVIWCCTPCHAMIHAYWRAQKRRAA